MSERLLALAVLAQAVGEVRHGRAALRAAASAFLGSEDAARWCALAGLDAEAVRRAAGVRERRR